MLVVGGAVVVEVVVLVVGGAVVVEVVVLVGAAVVVLVVVVGAAVVVDVVVLVGAAVVVLVVVVIASSYTKRTKSFGSNESPVLTVIFILVNGIFRMCDYFLMLIYTFRLHSMQIQPIYLFVYQLIKLYILHRYLK